MKPPTALTIAVSLGQASMAYVVRVYTELDCQGESQQVNVWDNSCRWHNLPKARSIELVAYGGWHQRACIYAEPWCALGWEDQTWWTDGGSVQVGDCKNFNFELGALASWFVGG